MLRADLGLQPKDNELSRHIGGGLQGGREEHGLRVTHLLSYAAPPYSQEGSGSTDEAGSMINRAAAVGHWPLGTLKTRPGHPGHLGSQMPPILMHATPEMGSAHGWTLAPSGLSLPESVSPLATSRASGRWRMAFNIASHSR